MQKMYGGISFRMFYTKKAHNSPMKKEAVCPDGRRSVIQNGQIPKKGVTAFWVRDFLIRICIFLLHAVNSAGIYLPSVAENHLLIIILNLRDIVKYFANKKQYYGHKLFDFSHNF